MGQVFGVIQCSTMGPILFNANGGLLLINQTALHNFADSSILCTLLKNSINLNGGTGVTKKNNGFLTKKKSMCFKRSTNCGPSSYALRRILKKIS